MVLMYLLVRLQRQLCERTIAFVKYHYNANSFVGVTMPVVFGPYFLCMESNALKKCTNRSVASRISAFTRLMIVIICEDYGND